MKLSSILLSQGLRKQPIDNWIEETFCRFGFGRLDELADCSLYGFDKAENGLLNTCKFFRLGDGIDSVGDSIKKIGKEYLDLIEVAAFAIRARYGIEIVLPYKDSLDPCKDIKKRLQTLE